MSTLASGRTVGRYRIVRFLGAGAMGEVYLAEDPHIERPLAIKTVRLLGRPHEIDDRTKRLLREARAAGRMLHPNVVTLFDAGEHDGMLYLAFEFVEGSDLAARLEAGPPLTLSEVLRIARETAEALEYAHRHGIVHRDIKPSNILLDLDGRVKVTDFGIAKMAGQTTELTVMGSVMGSPQYLSPEQIRGDELDGRSDVFSLGVVLYELLSGRRPFDGDTITTLVYQILHKDPPPVSELRGEVPPRLAALVARMLAKDRDERLGTARQVADELAAIARELPGEVLAEPAVMSPAELAPTRVLPGYTTGMSAVAPTPPQPAVPPPPLPPPAPAAVAPGRSPWLALAIGSGALLLIGALAAGWLLLRRPAAPPPPEAPSEMAARQPADGEPAAPASSASPAETDPVPARGAGRADPPATSAAPTVPPQRESVRPEPTAPASREAAPAVPPLARQAPRERLAGPADRSPDTAAPVEPEPAPRTGEPATELQPARPVDRALPPAASPAPAADRILQSGLNLAFRITPPDAHVLVNGTMIGRAEEWSGQKGSRVYNLPEAGEHLIKIRKDGMRELRIAVQASETSGTTPVVAQLRPLPAREVATPDLATYRVREAIALKVEPSSATVSVDGEAKGPASQFAGGLGRGRWLPLPQGRHRVSVAAPGFEQRDIAVEVAPDAERERTRIEVRLERSPG